MKALNFIFGIIAILCSGVFFADPILSKILFTYIGAVILGVLGLVEIIKYFVDRKKQKSNPTMAFTGTAGLVLGICAVVYALLNAYVPFFTLATEMLLAIMFTVFMLFSGISDIVTFFKTKDILSQGMRIFTLVLGILMVIASLSCLSCVWIVTGMFGIFIGVSLVFKGVDLIISAFN